jgi:hypothetical protein
MVAPNRNMITPARVLSASAMPGSRDGGPIKGGRIQVSANFDGT